MDFLENERDPSVVVFRDALFFMLFSLVVVIFLLAMLVGEPPQSGEGRQMRAEIEIEAMWPTGTKYDVDLWVLGPDAVPVGWNARSPSANLNLERDDKGGEDDAAQINYEAITVRKRVPGEYTVNLHMFHAHGEKLPLPVVVRVIGKGDIATMYKGSVLLERPFHEVTVIRFALDQQGQLVKDSISNEYREVVPVSTSYQRGKAMEFVQREAGDWPSFVGGRPGVTGRFSAREAVPRSN